MLISPAADALFVWRKFISADGQQGINCAVFRNEGPSLSSDLIRWAQAIAWDRWPKQRLYTYVNSRRIRPKRDPGRCFLKAGWRYCGITKEQKLHILEVYPEWIHTKRANAEIAAAEAAFRQSGEPSALIANNVSVSPPQNPSEKCDERSNLNE